METDAGKPREFCEICHIGLVQSYRTTYARWHDEQFVIVPSLPAWRCDFCGDTFYDTIALARLALLLGPESNLEDQPRWRTPGLDEHRDAGLGNRRRIG